MTDDHASGLVSQDFRGAVRRILMTDTVKSITADPLIEPFVWTRINVRRGFECRMEAGIEHGDLRHIRSEESIDGFNCSQLKSIVRGSDLCFLGDGGPDLRSQPCRLTILPAVDDAM